MREEFYLEELTEEFEEMYKEGIKNMDTGEFDKGREIFLQIIKEKPGFIPAYNKMAIISIYQKDMEKAGEWLEKTLQLDDEFAPALTNLGSIRREQGNKEAAKKLYQRAVEIDPEYGPAYNNLGVIYREEGEYKESVKHLKKANKLNSYTINTSRNNKPFYKEPGCLIGLISLAVLIIFMYILFR